MVQLRASETLTTLRSEPLSRELELRDSATRACHGGGQEQPSRSLPLMTSAAASGKERHVLLTREGGHRGRDLLLSPTPLPALVRQGTSPSVRRVRDPRALPAGPTGDR